MTWAAFFLGFAAGFAAGVATLGAVVLYGISRLAQDLGWGE